MTHDEIVTELKGWLLKLRPMPTVPSKEQYEYALNFTNFCLANLPDLLAHLRLLQTKLAGAEKVVELMKSLRSLAVQVPPRHNAHHLHVKKNETPTDYELDYDHYCPRCNYDKGLDELFALSANGGRHDAH